MGSLNTCLLILLLASISAVQSHSFPINVWPKPTSFAWNNPCATTLSPNFSISSPAHTNLNAAVRRYQKQLLTERHRPLVTPLLNLSSNSQPLTALNVAVTDVKVPLGHGVDESYTLVVPCDAGVAELKAETAWGAMRGLETLSQLVYAASGSGSSSTQSMVGCGLQISDKPLFTYRGVMLDTSRNYYTIKDLKRLVRTISMNKLNVFHWHVTDSHSFPLELSSEPTLAQKGSYGEYMTYTVDDVKKLIQYAMDRGVRIIPEIDMPGHTGSWAKAYPEIVTCAGKFWSPTDSGLLAAEPGTGQLNPLHPKTYQVVQNLINDVVSMFPDTFYHAGADEINPNCWKTDPSIQDYLSNNGTLSQILETFVNATLPQIMSLNRTVVYWEDVLLSPNINVSASLLPSENVVLQTWNNGPINTKTIVSSGYRAIVSSSDYYYLDCGHGDFLGNDSEYNQPPGTPQEQGGSWCGPFKTWQLIYNYDITYGLSEDESKLVLGGEVALWSEQADGNVMDARVWPRASAMGEALWSGNKDETGNSKFGEATDRLNEWRHRMVSRGIRVEPIQPLWCLMNPGMCNAVAS